MTGATRKIRASIRARLALERLHPRRWIAIRVASGVWLLVLTAVLYAYGVGGWWGALLVPAGALHFYWAFLLRREPPAGAAQ